MAPRALITLLAVALLATVPAWSSSAQHAAPKIVGIRIADSATARELAQRLPDTVTFDDRMGVAEVAHLRMPLDASQSAPMTAYHAGDVAYQVSQQSLIVFLSDGSAVPGGDLILVGHIGTGYDHIAGCTRDCTIHLDSITA